MLRRSMLLAATAALAFTAAGCGGGDDNGGSSASGDEAAVRKIADDGIKDARTLCDHFAPKLLKLYGGRETCRKGAGNPKAVTDAKVTRVTVKDDKATAIIEAGLGKLTTTMVKSGGKWQITEQK
ncbi:hypothetical protein DSM112329_04909 [Paraconexibacter sp. AEG42_29]|uniref:DUF4878 domain-containing protein n=1 Tax=Paraconexibacter sp. AEG42_29 TaxID=2997339 RepID=A0AAU7B394_9ACTN